MFFHYYSLDVIPPRFLAQIWDVVVGSMTLSILNQSLLKGVVPSYFKHALCLGAATFEKAQSGPFGVK